MLRDRIKELAQNHVNEGIAIGLEKGREQGIGIGRQEGIGIGREEGRLEGLKDSLISIIGLKYGDVPSAWKELKVSLFAAWGMQSAARRQSDRFGKTFFF